jgi:hypothetical protein
MPAYTVTNQDLVGGGISTSRLKQNSDGHSFILVKDAITFRLKKYGMDNAFDYLLGCCSAGRVTKDEAEVIFHQVF